MYLNSHEFSDYIKYLEDEREKIINEFLVWKFNKEWIEFSNFKKQKMLEEKNKANYNIWDY
jgi:hypothetical protein